MVRLSWWGLDTVNRLEFIWQIRQHFFYFSWCNIFIHPTSSILMENLCSNLHLFKLKTKHLFDSVVLIAAPQVYYWHEVKTLGVNEPRSKSPALNTSNLLIQYSLISKLVNIWLIFCITPRPNLLLLRCSGIQMSLAEMHEVVEEAA